MFKEKISLWNTDDIWWLSFVNMAMYPIDLFSSLFLCTALILRWAFTCTRKVVHITSYELCLCVWFILVCSWMSCWLQSSRTEGLLQQCFLGVVVVFSPFFMVFLMNMLPCGPGSGIWRPSWCRIRLAPRSQRSVPHCTQFCQSSLPGNTHTHTHIAKFNMWCPNRTCRRVCFPAVMPRTWLSTSMAMSTNMSCSSRMLFSSLMISVCRVSISFRACLVIWESILICRRGQTLFYCDDFQTNQSKKKWNKKGNQTTKM